MAKYTWSFGSANIKRRFKIGATVVAEQVVIYDEEPGVVTSPTKTAAADAFGCTMDAGTYSTTQGDAEGTSEVNFSPLSVFEAAISGASGDNENVALSITENDVAETAGTVISDVDLPSDSMVGGLVYGLKGANVSISRKVTTFVSASSLVVGVPFLNDIASGDQFLVFAGGPGRALITITTSFTQVSQWYAASSGIAAAVVDILIDDNDKANPTARMHFFFRDHVFNPLS